MPLREQARALVIQMSYAQRDATKDVTHLPCVFRPWLQCHRAREVRRDLLRG